MALEYWSERDDKSIDATTRTAHRTRMERLARSADFLPAPDRELFQRTVLAGCSAQVIALERGVSETAIRRRVRAIERRVSDPCFLLAVRFAEQLPEPLALTAKHHFQYGFSLAACAESQGVSLHAIRRQVLLARALLIQAAAKKYGGVERRGQLFVAALLGGLPVAERLRRIRAAETAAT